MASLLGPRVHTLRSRLGRTGIVALAAVLIVLGVSALLDLRGDEGDRAEFTDYVRSAGSDPLEFVVAAAAARRLLFLADVHPASEPKRLAADAIERIAREGRLDAVVLEVPAQHQPAVDLYLNTSPENAALLLDEPEITRESWGTAGSLMPVYRAVWHANQELPPSRRIRIIAADTSSDTDMRQAPRELARTFARRTDHMEEALREFLRMHTRARLLVLVDGYQTLTEGAGQLRGGGGDAVSVPWLAARLRATYGGDVFGILVDGTTLVPTLGEFSYRGTLLGPVLAAADVPSRAVLVNDRLSFVSDPIGTEAGPGLDLEILPGDYELRDVADGYIYLGD